MVAEDVFFLWEPLNLDNSITVVLIISHFFALKIFYAFKSGVIKTLGIRVTKWDRPPNFPHIIPHKG